MKIAINSTSGYGVKKKLVNNLFQVIGKVMPRYSTSEVSVAFVANHVIRQLNSRYRKKNSATDVLSFAERDTKLSSSLNKEKYLGEIIISYPYAKRQAREHKHSIDKELMVLITHGFLHLVGNDHLNKKDEQKMKRLEIIILNKIVKKI